MGSWLTRTRAWVYIAFYDEYVGRHINTSAGLSLAFFIPLYIYGIHVNRIAEQNANHYFYNWAYFDKRNRLTHNLIMEHFEMHKEMFEDVIVELHVKGPAVFENLPPPKQDYDTKVDLDDFALIDELSGLTEFVDSFMLEQDMPEATRERLKAHVFRYSGAKPKQVALNELKIKLFGDSR